VTDAAGGRIADAGSVSSAVYAALGAGDVVLGGVGQDIQFVQQLHKRASLAKIRSIELLYYNYTAKMPTVKRNFQEFSEKKTLTR